MPVRLRLKSYIKTPKAISTIRKTEKALLNERVRTINNTTEIHESQSYTCKTELSRVVDQETMAECIKFMFKIKEDRHFNTLERQKAKLNRLIRKEELINKGGCSKSVNMQRYMHQSSTNSSRKTAVSTTATPTTNDPENSRSTATTSTVGKSKWAIKMSKKPLTNAQEKLLAYGPNYAITPRSPPIGEYIAAVEQTCQSLTQGEADEMRVEIKAAIKRATP